MAVKKKSNVKKILTWVVVIALFYVLTSASVSTETVEQTRKINSPTGVTEKVVVEKTINVTEYKTEKVPYGVPRCELANYNFSRDYIYSEEAINGTRYAVCTYVVTNEEDLPGTFIFYSQIFKNGAVSDGPDETQTIPALGTATYVWKFPLALTDTATCLLQIRTPIPQREKCFYLEPITYQIKQVPVTVQEKKNITEERVVTSTMIKENVTRTVYTNKLLGFRQFYYFGY